METKGADGSCEQLLDPTSWVVNVVVIVKLDVSEFNSDIFKRVINNSIT